MTYGTLFDLTGRNAIVTGGAGILGQHFCHALAAHGARVAVVDVDASAAEELAAELDDTHAPAPLAVDCDVSDPDDVASMTKTVQDAFGKIDILHNNAATKSDDLDAFFAAFEDFDLDTWREIMAVNLDGMFLVAQHIGDVMADQEEGGSIIQTASIYGVRGVDDRIYEGSEYMGRQINTPAVYSASKGGVVALTKYLATYWGDDGIRVNTLTPGGVESGQNDAFKEKYSRRVPFGRMGTPEEMVGALVFLASSASSYVTGQNIIIDGGLTAW